MKQIDNPFADLREELPIKDSKKEERRVWHPSGRDDPGDHRSLSPTVIGWMTTSS